MPSDMELQYFESRGGTRAGWYTTNDARNRGVLISKAIRRPPVALASEAPRAT